MRARSTFSEALILLDVEKLSNVLPNVIDAFCELFFARGGPNCGRTAKPAALRGSPGD